MTEELAPTAPAYADDDLVYVDPEASAVVGRVEFGKNGQAKKMEMPEHTDTPETTKDGRPKRQRSKRYYPWGTYRSMKKIYKIEGKVPKTEPVHTLDEVIDKALQEPFW